MKRLWTALLLLAAPAWAHAVPGDDAPPNIQHTVVRRIDPGAALEVRARVTDPSGVFDPVLSWRHQGDASFQRVPMRAHGAGEYSASVSGASIHGNLEYFLEAFDELGNGPGRYASPEKPVRVAVATVEQLAGVEPEEPPPTPPPAQPAPVAAKTTPAPKPQPAKPAAAVVVKPRAQPETQATVVTPPPADEPESSPSRLPLIVGGSVVAAGGAVLLLALAAAAIGGGSVLAYLALGPSGFLTPEPQSSARSRDVKVSGPSPAQ